jgi:signal transduction histidine kinase
MSSLFQRMLRLTSLGVWFTLLLPILHGAANHQDNLTWSKAQLWIGLWLVFGAALFAATSPRPAPRGLRAAMFALQTLSALSMCGLQPDFYVGFLLVIIAWQLAVFLPVRVAAAWVLVQAAALFLVLSPICANGCGWAASGIYFAFQGFFLVTVLLVKREWEQRLEQARLNAELTATQDLLIERSSSYERLRISRELHDVLGHSLTALSLHLEVAMNTPQAAARDRSLIKAQAVTKALIGDVRDVVGALRNSETLDVAHALEVLAAGAPELAVHIATPEGLRLEDPERAQALLRCVQEVITNTRKHARARNIWIDITETAGELVVQARDDGRGLSGAAASGFGLAGMRERFVRLGGDVQVEPSSGPGFALSARFPLKPSPAAA